MTIPSIIILGIIQGLTEFLPISSDGHLVLAEHYLHLAEPSIALGVILHMGTLLAILVYFAKDLVLLAQGWVMSWVPIWRSRSFAPIMKDQYMGDSWLILVASVPTALIGIFGKDIFNQMYQNPIYTGLGFLVTAGFVLTAARLSAVNKTSKQISWQDALLIGTFQGLAIAPGISRSGSTIAGGLLRGLDAVRATRFSFCLAVPALVGAGLLEIREISALGDWHVLLIGFLTSFVVGLLALQILFRVVRSGRLQFFGYYCIALAVCVFILEARF